MNAYPSWIHRIPEMIEVLAMAEAEHIDRRVAERLFDLRGTAAKALLRRMGADLCQAIRRPPARATAGNGAPGDTAPRFRTSYQRRQTGAVPAS